MFGGIDFQPLDTVKGFFSTLDRIGFGADGFFIQTCALLLIVFLVWQMWQAALSGRGSQVTGTFMRGIVAAALLAATPTAQELLRQGWENTYKWANLQVAAVQADRIADLETQVASLTSDDIGRVAAMVAGFFFQSTPDTSGASDALADNLGYSAGGGALVARSLVKSVFSNVFRAFRFLFIPVVAFYMVLIFTSGLIVGIATALLPLGIALVASGVGTHLLIGLLSKLLSAFASITLIPLIFALIFNIAILTPLKGVLQMLTTFVVSIGDVSFHGLFSGGGIGWDGIVMPSFNWEVFGTGLVGVLEVIDNAFNVLFGGMIITGAALLAAVLIVSQVDQLVASLLNGIGTGAGKATGVFASAGGAALAGRAAGAAAARGTRSSTGTTGTGHASGTTGTTTSNDPQAPQGEVSKAEVGGRTAITRVVDKRTTVSTTVDMGDDDTSNKGDSKKA